MSIELHGNEPEKRGKGIVSWSLLGALLICASLCFFPSLSRFIASRSLSLTLTLPCFHSLTHIHEHTDRLSFYNAHMSFYENYFAMVVKYARIVFDRYVLQWRSRPLSFLYIPSVIFSIVSGWRAFNSPPKLDKDE